MQEKMKNTFRRLLSIVAAIAMAIGIVGGSTVPAMADDAPSNASDSQVTVTINNNHPSGSEEDGPDYHWYVMMWASLGGGERQVSYYVDKSTLADALANLKVDNKNLFTVTRVGTEDHWNVTLNHKTEASGETEATDFTPEDVASALQSIVKDKTGDELNSLTEQTGEITRSKDTNKTFTINDNGYVLITSSLGSKLIADTCKNTTVTEKNTYPTVNKTQSKTSDGTYTKDDISQEVGKTVYYQVPVTIPVTVTKPITVVDTITKGLTMDTTSLQVTATYGTTFQNVSWQLDTQRTNALTNGNGAKVYTFTIDRTAIENLVTATKNDNKTSTTVTLSYTARVNKDAIDFDSSTWDNNKAHIEYDNYVTPDIEVDVKSYKFQILKYDAAETNGASYTPLGGAKFQLLKGSDKTLVRLVPADNLTDHLKYRVAEQDETGAVDNFVTVSGAGHQIEISGLDKDEQYYLREIEAPSGYNKLTEDFEVEKEAVAESKTVSIANHQGSVLPSTGGIGTTVFYVLGGCLIAVAAVALIARKKRNA